MSRKPYTSEQIIGKLRKAGMDHSTFHDLRQTARNNWWLQGHDYFRIMAATRHKAMTVSKRFSVKVSRRGGSRTALTVNFILGGGQF